MLSEAKHLLYLLENKQSRSFASLRMTPREGFFSNLLRRSMPIAGVALEMSIPKHSEAQIIEPLKQGDAGRTAGLRAMEIAMSSYRCRSHRPASKAFACSNLNKDSFFVEPVANVPEHEPDGDAGRDFSRELAGPGKRPHGERLGDSVEPLCPVAVRHQVNED